MILGGGVRMHFALVDDEPEILKEISDFIKQCLADDSIEIDCFFNAYDFLTSYALKKYDALFLDIDMPDINGFELAENLRYNNDNVPIIYITAREDLIIQAFRYKALGFVRKQFIENELPFALDSIYSEVRKKTDKIEVTETRTNGGRSHILEINQIMFIESIRNNVRICLLGNKEVVVRSSLKYFSEHKGFEHFTAINSGTLVNLSLIELTKDKVRFSDGTELFISRRKLNDVREAYLNNIKKVLI